MGLLPNKHLRRREAGRHRILKDRPLCALVTGASSGIGKAMAELLAENHHDLVLVARRRALLEEVATDLNTRYGVNATAITGDLGNSDTPAEIVAELERLGIAVDVLVNNAGYTMDGHYLSYTWEQHREYQQVMAIAPAELTYRLLPGMVQRNFGQVINMASAASLMPATPFNALYGPCKHHVMVLTRSLQGEFGPAGITFSVCFPPPVSGTGIVEQTPHGQAWARYKFLLVSPRHVAELAYQAVEKGKVAQPVGPTTIALGISNHLLPAGTFANVMGASVRFLSKEKRITDAATAGLTP